MIKKIKLDRTCSNELIEIWELDRKGYYCFTGFLDTSKMNDFYNQYKNYEIVDKLNLLKGIKQ